MNDATKIADHLASKDAQYILNWIFIFVIITGAIAAFFIARWFIQYLMLQRELLVGLFKDMGIAREQDAKIITENSMVVRECKEKFADCQEAFRDCTELIRRIKENGKI